MGNNHEAPLLPLCGTVLAWPNPSIHNVAGFVVESMAWFESEWVAGLRLESMVDSIGIRTYFQPPSYSSQ